MQIYSAADYTAGSTGVVSLATILGVTSQLCKWFQITTLATNAAAVRIGDANVGVARGIPILPTGASFAPPVAEPSARYELCGMSLYMVSGDKVSVAWAV